uniref:DUF4249 domain-containing protein n=1 Tax=Roseihalotalea indica TaxID=2867963 RepID=A0AA49JFW9_9BACT|nr:DUF4249 domain-containing protein [Tunicatimonas sp. TK19036]
MNYLRGMLILSLFMSMACEKDIQIELPVDLEGTVVIEGLLYPGKEPRIYISKSEPFFDSNVTPQEVFARGARVNISHRQESEVLVPDSTFDKFRCRWVPFYEGSRAVKFGETYTLKVQFEGKTYTASTTINQTRAVIKEIIYTPEFTDIYGGHDGVNVRIQDPAGADNFYRFQMNRFIDRDNAHAHELDGVPRDCTGDEEFYMTDLGRTIYTDIGNDGRTMDLLAEVSFEYNKGDSTWVIIQSLDERSAAFYQELDDQLISILNPFVEPVFIKSQIEGGALGVFGSAVLSDSVLFIYPQDNPL